MPDTRPPEPLDWVPEEFRKDPLLFHYDWPSKFRPEAAPFALCIACSHRSVMGPRENLLRHLDRNHPGWAERWWAAIAEAIAGAADE